MQGFLAAVLGLGIALGATPARAQTYPAAPVKVVVPFGAGGATDILARVFSDRLAQNLGPKGIRVNGISAGPIKTLAAAGISNFSKLLGYHAKHAPLRCNTTIEDVGNAAAFMLSDLASGITGEILYVDGGFNTTALGNPE